MGTITRNFANNLTTSGLLKPDAFNNNSFDNVTAVPSGSVETGAMQFISSATASFSSSLEFTSGIDSTYKEYIIYFLNLQTQNNDVKFEYNLSTDNGSTYNVAKTTTYFSDFHYENDSNADLSYNGSQDSAQSTGNEPLVAFNLVNYEADISFDGFFRIFNPSSTTYVKHFICETCVPMDGGGGNFFASRSFLAGYGNTLSAVNGFRISVNSGSIRSGKILLFGIN